MSENHYWIIIVFLMRLPYKAPLRNRGAGISAGVVWDHFDLITVYGEGERWRNNLPPAGFIRELPAHFLSLEPSKIAGEKNLA